MPDSLSHKDGSAPPRAFISYTHESEEHIARVLTLANRLRQDGIHAMLDRYEADPSEGWPAWSEKQIRDADFVLMICTETYNRRLMGDENSETGHGVIWEGKLIYQYIYEGQTPRKFIPVLFNGKPTDIPTPLRGLIYFDVSTDAGYEALYRRLFNLPATVIPPIGQRRGLPPRQRTSAEPASSTSTTPAHQAGELTIDALSNLALSVESKKILHRARILATFGNDDPPRVSTSCLLVGIAEGGREQTDPFMTPQFLWREIQRADEPSYRKFLRERFPHIKYSSSDETIAFDRTEQADLITANVLNVFRHAQEISRATVSLESESQVADKPLGEISARHLFAALLILEHTGASDRLARVFDLTMLRSKFLTFIVESIPVDDADAWRKILAPEETSLETESELVAEGAAIAAQVDKDFRARLPGFQTDHWVGEDLLG
ncbi:MAG: toll/interleukin-1 receptor domain-containing protein, partial [Pyrinomonadaceae bacterium]